MIVKQNIFTSFKKMMLATTAVVGLMQCSTDEQISSPVVSDADITAQSAEESSVASLTVTGSNTEYTKLQDCKTCSYIVSANEEIIDGKAINFKPGNIICLKAGVKYGDLEFVNIEGTEEHPIVIATVGKRAVIASNATPENPY